MVNNERRPVLFSMFTDADLQRIHDVSMKLLWENGINFPDEQAIKLFKKHDFKVNGEQVYITEQQVRRALETAPTSFVINGVKKTKSLNLGGGDYGIPGPIGPVNVSTLDDGRREGTLKDVENLVKIYHASEVMTMNSNNGVEACDIPAATSHLEIMRAVLRHTDKPFYTKLFDYEKMHQAIDMVEIVCGEKLQPGSNVYIAPGSCPSLSPMAFGSEVCGNIIALAERGQVVVTGSATSTGVTGPIYDFGTLVMQNAELIAAIVLTQLVNPGNPVAYGTGATPGNMKMAQYCCGSPNRVFLQLGTLEMGKRFYKLPARSLTYGSDSTCLDVQAGIESFEGTMANTLGNADFMLSEIGTLEGLLTTSYEKTILDEEITSRLMVLREGIDISALADGFESVMRVGSNGTFLIDDDTLSNFSDGWYPKYTNWDANVSTRPVDDYSYVLRRANAEWKRRLAEAPETLLDEGIEEALADYIKNHSS